MNSCREIQNLLPEIMEGSARPEQQAHLRSCPECSGLVKDLQQIVRQASLLTAAEEPSLRVWNGIRSSLEQEGLIRMPARSEAPHGRLLDFLAPSRWRPVLVPLAAALLIAAGLFLYQGFFSTNSNQQATNGPAVAPKPAAVAPVPGDQDDEQLLAEVAGRSPTMRSAYADHLKHVNSYIRDAEQSVKDNPNDEQARQSLMDAYEQKAMVYDLAMDRSLP
jgi:hypothetical protein